MFLDPIPAVISYLETDPAREDEPVLLLGYLSEDRMLYADADGHLATDRLYMFVVDYRYDPEAKVWHDPTGEEIVAQPEKDPGPIETQPTNP